MSIYPPSLRSVTASSTSRRVRLRRVFWIGVLALAACDAAPSAAPDAQSADAAVIPLRACPSEDLSTFVRAFAEDTSLQRTFTAPSVKAAFVDWNAEPEPKESVRTVPRDTLQFPVLPNATRQKKEGLRYRQLSVDGKRAEVAFEVPDTDTQLRYTFERGACWTLVKIVDPAFGKQFDTAGDGRGPFLPALDERGLVQATMRARYGEPDGALRCWPTVLETAGHDPLAYCMRPGPATVVSTSQGRLLLFLAHNVQDVGARPRRFYYGADDPGLAGLFAVSLGERGESRVAAFADAVPLGTQGDCGCENAQPVHLGRDMYGWMFSTGGTWQGVRVSSYDIYAENDGAFLSVGTFADVEERRQDLRRRITIDASRPDAPHYPLIVTTWNGAREVDRHVVYFDAQQHRYPSISP